jgi:anti-anti-sigma factor
MEIIVSQEQGRVPVTIFRLKERINLGNVEQLVGKARQVFDVGARDLLIDLAEVPSITSAGIGAIHAIYKLFNIGSMPKSPHVKLLSPTADVRRILTLVGFDAFIDIFDNQEEALKAF